MITYGNLSNNIRYLVSIRSHCMCYDVVCRHEGGLGQARERAHWQSGSRGRARGLEVLGSEVYIGRSDPNRRCQLIVH
jgi:hypothetical protein